ncbi:hypothetical protein ABEY55_21995 [Priestia aryabhattai]|uniref:hypothetical protein n=1 Tax=Priestia aryabhattai TaxID=412384 RepID=UPI003D2D362E
MRLVIIPGSYLATKLSLWAIEKTINHTAATSHYGGRYGTSRSVLKAWHHLR